MTDRELLELAAKAAGLSAVFDMYGWDEIGDGAFWDANEPPTLWNPLTDDGDALRLLASCKINLEHMETLSRKPHGINCWPVGKGECAAMEHDLSDYGAAIRRAIVGAAAEIGRAMGTP